MRPRGRVATACRPHPRPVREEIDVGRPRASDEDQHGKPVGDRVSPRSSIHPPLPTPSSKTIGVFIRGDGYGDAFKGENGASSPTQPRRTACESANAATHQAQKRIRPSSTSPFGALTETLPASRGEGQDRRWLCSGSEAQRPRPLRSCSPSTSSINEEMRSCRSIGCRSGRFVRTS